MRALIELAALAYFLATLNVIAHLFGAA